QFILLIFAPISVIAQLVVDGTVTPQNAVEDVLLGNGVQVSGITFSGDANQIGSFNSTNSNIGLLNGVVLATGDVAVSIGPNDAVGDGLGGGNFGVNDPDLDQLSTFDTNDAAVLEFDFIPTGDSIVFRYVFASEEYNEYVCGSVNDAFGFFLSGPGINGPFSNNAVNLALVPETDIPVTINTVNNGNVGANGFLDNCEQVSPDWDLNTEYYIDNENNNDPNSTQFDGLTVVLTAIAVVDCGEEYHIKIAIADAGDTAFDSAVFLEAESFSSNAVNIVADASIADAPVFLGDSVLVEGCNEALIQLIRPNASLEDTLIFSYSGTALEFIDYTDLPDTVIMEEGVFQFDIPIQAILDVEDEDPETIIMNYEYINDCGDTTLVSETLYIFDYLFPEIQGVDGVSDCPGSLVEISADVLDGYTPFFWNWENGGDTQVIGVNPLETTTYTVIATDICGEEASSEVTVVVNPPPALELNTEDVTSICPGQQVNLSVEVNGGIPQYTYLWSNNSVNANTQVNPTETETFSVTVSDQCSQSENIEITVNVTEYPELLVTGNGGFGYCPNDNVTLSSSAQGGLAPYTFAWNGASTGADGSATVSPNQTTTYTITVTDACGVQSTDTALVNVSVWEPISILSDTICAGEMGTFAPIEGGTGVFTFALDTITDDYITIAQNLGGGYTVAEFTPDEAVFNVIVTDECGNFAVPTITSIVCDTFIPNVFTPGDGNNLNETFEIPGINRFPGSELIVLNRWGNVVYESTNYTGNWNGTDEGGGDLSEGTYFYVLNRSDGESFSGTISLLR
ncbi:MAG: choice-of-anchor L domain-containing protein, partial [Flavobacteriales bacterium]